MLREPCRCAGRGDCRSLGRPSGNSSSSLRFNHRPTAPCGMINITLQSGFASCLYCDAGGEGDSQAKAGRLQAFMMACEQGDLS